MTRGAVSDPALTPPSEGGEKLPLHLAAVQCTNTSAVQPAVVEGAPPHRSRSMNLLQFLQKEVDSHGETKTDARRASNFSGILVYISQGLRSYGQSEKNMFFTDKSQNKRNFMCFRSFQGMSDAERANFF